MFDISLIKQRINCVDVAQQLGLPIYQPGDRCVSPLRDGASNSSSFVVDKDFWYDFGGAHGGDAIDLMAEVRYGGNRGDAIRELARITGVTDSNPHPSGWVDYTNQMNAMAAFYHTQLTEEDKNYLHSRGITDEDADRLLIGRVTDGALKGRLFLPYFQNGYVCYYATRALPGSAFPDNKYMKQRKDDYCQHVPWGLQTLNRDSDTLVIAEGYFDAVSFEATGHPVLSAITGTFSKSQIPMVISIARKFKRVFIVYDNDPITGAGATFTQRMAEILTRSRIPFVVGVVPPPYHDISEYYAAGGDLSRIIDSAESGISYVASKISDFSDLERFIFTVARYTKRSELETVIDQLKRVTTFDPKRLDTLFKTATTAPPETIVADEIIRSRRLIYIPAVGFYEYSSGVWIKQPEEVIQVYADQTYGEFSTSQRVRAVTNLVKTRTLRQDVQFDKQPVWNFINGTLDLDSGKFREHNPNDFCSIQVNYPYNPEAGYSAWSQFIDDITAGDPKAAEILQFIPGYTLFHDCQHEKIFVLSGNGSNGKSKYLAILRELFGAGNTVSHLQPRGMLDRFRLIQFREAIINLAGEIRSDLRDAEEVMKSIASGEPQSACYKGKDFVTFIPRTKLIFATNAPLTSGDTSDGLTRRLIIVDFKVSFVDNPNPDDPYQRQKKIDILDQLTQELNSGGIFNWAYEGYKLLKTVGYFTETEDQGELIREFQRSSNPVLVFWELSENRPAEYDYNQAYSDYVEWCKANGYEQLNSQIFHREYKKVSSGFYEAVNKSVRVDGKPRKRRFYRLLTTG